MNFPHLEDIEVAGKTVLVRTDLNVPMHGGQVTDNTRIVRLLPTLHYLIKKKCRIVLLSHFGRPKGQFVPSLSQAPLVDAVSSALDGKEVQFGVDCIGEAARTAVKKLKPGEILLLENLRFHPEEESGNVHFAEELASLGDVFINDAFSASHRAHASITGIANYLPLAAGKLMQQELEMLDSIFGSKQTPIAAVIGGAKVSTKLELLENLSKTMDVIIIGGAMANTFFHAQGHKIGKSLCEPKLKAAAQRILKNAEKNNCKIVLPVDAVVATEFKAQAVCSVHDIGDMDDDGMIVDVGPASVALFAQELAHCKTVIWNGPLGAFETSPFDASTVTLARSVAGLTTRKKIRSIAGGGDTVSALTHSGLAQSFSYISTGGGAFLEWLEGKTLPGVASLMKAAKPHTPKTTAKRRKTG